MRMTNNPLDSFKHVHPCTWDSTKWRTCAFGAKPSPKSVPSIGQLPQGYPVLCSELARSCSKASWLHSYFFLRHQNQTSQSLQPWAQPVSPNAIGKRSVHDQKRRCRVFWCQLGLMTQMWFGASGTVGFVESQVMGVILCHHFPHWSCRKVGPFDALLIELFVCSLAPRVRGTGRPKFSGWTWDDAQAIFSLKSRGLWHCVYDKVV